MAVAFSAFFISLIIGIPIGFGIVLSSLLAVAAGGGAIAIVSQRFVTGAGSFTMLAIPLFIFSGNLMKYGCSQKLVNLADMSLNRVPGSTGSVGIVSSALFGSVSGSSVATTAAIGSITEPEMLKRKYGKGYTASIMAAGGTLGSLIPPSINAVLYAGIAGTSVGSQLMAGLVPGLVLMATFIIYNTIVCKKRGYDEGSKNVIYDSKQKIKVILESLPALAMPIIIVGGIMGGIITPTEAAVVATLYALLISMFYYKELDIKQLMNVTLDSVKSSCVVLLIIAAANPFSWVLTTQNIAAKITGLIFSITSSPFLIMTLIIVIIIIMGTFMEAGSITILTTPFFLPIVQQIGIDPIHFGVIMNIATCIGVVSPPLAVGLYTACSIIGIKVEDTIPDVLYFMGVMTIATIIITIFPQLSLGLPNALF